MVPLKKMTEVMISAIYTENMMALLKKARFMRANQGAPGCR